MAQTGRLRGMKLVLSGLGMLVAGVALAAFAIVAWTAHSVHASRRPDWLGNSPENVRRLTARADANDLVFYAMGDVGLGLPTFETLLRTISAEEPDFLIVLGDLINNRQGASHQFFIHEIAKQRLSFPVLVVPGNHDIAATGEFRLQEFEQIYGPAQFHFTIGNCLFLFLNNALTSGAGSEDYLAFMERVLSERAAQARNVFVFSHVPPTGLTPLVRTHEREGSDRFMALARKHNVQFVFSGDHHGYWKGVRDGTTYVITGGAGAPLRGRRGRFHHAVRVAVESGTIVDTVLAVEREHRGLRLAARNIVVYIWPLLTGNWISVTLTALGLVALALLGASSARRWRRLRGQAAS